VDYELFEAAPRLGGVLASERVDGCLVEAGTDSFLTEKPWASELCRELGLQDQIIGSNDSRRKTYILVHNRLIEMPDGLMFMVPTRIAPMLFTPLFSWSTKVRMAREFLSRPHTVAGDESVASLVARHFGEETVQRLADPLLSGVYGGSAAQLSARATLARFVDMEKTYGSLIRGMLASRRRMAKLAGNKPKPPLFSALRNGMQQLLDALVGRLNSQSLNTDTKVSGVSRIEGGWEIVRPGGKSRFDAVVLATPAHVSGQFLTNTDPLLAEELNGIVYSSSVTVTMIFEGAEVLGRDHGFGFLVPRSEERRMLACTFVHNKFPHRVPENESRGIVRCFLGAGGDEKALDLSDTEILAILRRELCEITGISAEPRAARIYRWRRAMAQPSPGHLDRVARLEERLKRLPGLALAGNYLRGIGVPDCINSGRKAAESVA
jgi:oxygen-dependent protoporphyrinogen oxidase